ncbi:MAG: DUF2851 family protein [Flavobacteriales bacterium]|nr:DUF2851 family protein [Flavobacteriales bacterium]
MQTTSAHSLLLDPAFPYGEDLLQYIWENRMFEQHALRTTDGREVEVVKPGRIQPDSGPDLVDAQVRIDGQLWAGTVEVHTRSSEWNAHGHGYDAAYENVVLHVVYEHDAEVRTMNGHVLPTVELFPRISTDSIALYLSLMRGKGFVPCASQLDRVDHARTSPWLERVLIERLERKTLEVEALYRKLNSDPSETVYHMLVRAFGLKVNAEPFSMLAHALPLRVVLKYRDDALRTEALLFGQAGLLQVDFVDECPRQLQQEHNVLAHLHGLRPAPVAAWKFARMRPVNFPTVRIAQFAQVLMRCDGDFSALIGTDNVNELLDLLDVEASAYWIDHYRFDTPSAPRSKRLGRAGAEHILINAVVPTLFALGRIQGRQEYSDRALGLMEQLPAERNTLISGWAGLGLKADTAARGQALIELKNEYCAKRRCLSCGIGNQLLRNTVK